MPPKRKAETRVRLTPYLRGVIYGLFLAGYTYQEIADEVEKADGTNPCQQSVASVISQAKSHGGLQWDGEAEYKSASSSVGRPRETTQKLDRQILQLVFKHRGKALVTVAFIKKMIRAARKHSHSLIERRLGQAGLAWLRRRRKSIVPAVHKTQRLEWAAWVLTRTATTLARWAYSDGTVFYLARTDNEKASSSRGALGPQVWRQTCGADALYEDCVGPSAYWKSQGAPVRIWGLLVGGMLFVYVLPAGNVMNRWWYSWLVSKKFPEWMMKAMGHGKKFLVQDHERCLWAAESRVAMREQKISLLENFPKSSQDLNPIETAWREVRARLACTEPSSREQRNAFIRRLRQAVVWVNKNRAAYLQELCTSQKKRARDVQVAKGTRTKH